MKEISYRCPECGSKRLARYLREWYDPDTNNWKLYDYLAIWCRCCGRFSSAENPFHENQEGAKCNC